MSKTNCGIGLAGAVVVALANVATHSAGADEIPRRLRERISRTRIDEGSPVAAGFDTEKKITASDGAANDEFGLSVAISGDTAIVGARGDDDNGGRSGSAYVYLRDKGGANNWGQVAKITASDGAALDNFGFSVAISGDTAIVGSVGDDDNGAQSGSVYVYKRDEGGMDNWGQVAKFTADDGAAEDQFGVSIAISGNTVIVGAVNNDENGASSGSAYVYQQDEGGVGNWGQVTKITAADGAAFDQFGVSVAIGGDTAIVGAYLDDDDGEFSGSAYVYRRSEGGVNNWGQVTKITASDAEAGDEFGVAVAISGDTAIVGAFADGDNGFISGSAYVYRRDEGGVDNWGQVTKITATDGATGDFFGGSVAISGDTAVVGAYLDDDGGTDSGSAYVYQRDEGGVDNWGEVTKITASDGAAEDAFGVSVAISGDTATVGAWHDGDSGSNSGSAYAYQRGQGINWINSAGGSFLVGGNWAGGVAPDETETAVFNLSTAGYTVTFDADVTTAELSLLDDTLTFDLGGFQYDIADQFTMGLAGDTTDFTVRDGTLSINAGPVAIGTLAAATLTVDSGGVFEAGNPLPWDVGPFGVVSVLSGGTLETGGSVTPGGLTTIGTAPGGTATVLVSGSGSAWSASGPVTVGDAGPALLTVEQGGFVGITNSSPFLVASLGTVNVTTGATLFLSGGDPGAAAAARDLDGVSDGRVASMSEHVMSVFHPIQSRDREGAVSKGAARTVSAPSRSRLGKRTGMPTTDPSEARAAGTGGALNVSDEGSVKVAGNAMLTVVGEVTLAPGGTYAPDSARTAATSATLEADTVLITSDNFPNGAKGVMLLEDTMRVEVGLSAARLTASGDFKLFCGGAVRDGNLRPGGDPSRGGCTPPILNASGGSQLQLGGSLIIEGDVNLRIRNVPIVATSSTASPQSGTTPGVTIGGDFDNRATDPTLFDWRSGSLAMTGVDATFKIAGQDVGDDPSGFMNNYAMGRIDVGPGASVRFIASEAGFPGDGLPAGLYVGEFVLSAGSTITIDGATVGYQVFDDQGGTVVLENGGELLPVPCATNADCDDASGCTFEQCVGSVCTSGPSRYGDLAGDGGTCGPDGDVNLSDILAVLDGFSGTFSPGCERANIDIAGDAGSCAPNGSIDLGDILAVLDAFQGLDSCCADGR